MPSLRGVPGAGGDVEKGGESRVGMKGVELALRASSTGPVNETDQ